MWNLSAPPGFQGLRDDRPLRIYQQELPHWRQIGATYFVTFRLDDSLPEVKLRELRRRKTEWERAHPPPRSREILEELSRELGSHIEGWLDEGHGRCVLRNAEAAQSIVDAMLGGHGSSHELGVYVVMPNHVHAVVRPLLAPDYDLEDVCRTWKGRSARGINRRLESSGSLWQRESYDRIIRDEEHLWRVIQYIGRNPGKAKLPPGSIPLWINPGWEALGWRFEM